MIGNRRDRTGQLSFAALLAVALLLPTPPASSAEPLQIFMDRAEVVKLPEKVGTIIIGNPLIADVSVQSGGLMVVTGKGYGTTNIVVLDRGGATLMERSVEVHGPRDNVVIVYRGVERESYSCLPSCERRITLGDSPNFFSATLTQTGARSGQAGGAASAPAR